MTLEGAYRVSLLRAIAVGFLWYQVTVVAQDPLYRLPSSRSASASLVSSSRPWRPPATRNSHHAASSGYGDLSSHFLDLEDASKDRRARQWMVNLKTRNVGKLSWTSRILWSTVATFLAQTCKPEITQWGLKISEKILKGEQLYRLVTPVFLHGSISHIAMNMLSLSRVGQDMEKLFGPGRFVTTYLFSGVAGNICSAYMSPNPGLGASGAVFGVIGAYYVFLSRNEWLLGPGATAMTTNISSTMLFNVFLGLMNPVIDNWAHLGGAVGGAAMAYYFGPCLYLTELPGGGRMVVDRPICRLPRKFEAIPENIGNQIQRVSRRMRIEGVKSGMPQRPWQQRMEQERQRKSAPARSVKPGKVD